MYYYISIKLIVILYLQIILLFCKYTVGRCVFIMIIITLLLLLIL